MLDWEWLIGDAVIGALLPGLRTLSPADRRGAAFLPRPTAPPGIAEILADQAALSAGASAEERLVALADAVRPCTSSARSWPATGGWPPSSTPPPATGIASARDPGGHHQEDAGRRARPAGAAGRDARAAGPRRGQRGRGHPLSNRKVPPGKVIPSEASSRSSSRASRTAWLGELGLLQDVGGFLDERCAAFGIPPLDYREVFDQVREKLGTEVNLEGEQRHLARPRDLRIRARGPDPPAPALLLEPGHGHGAGRRPQGDRAGRPRTDRIGGGSPS